MLEVIVPSAIVVVGAVGTFFVRVEHRITKLETKMDMLLKKNGINPNGSKKEKKDSK